MNRDVEIVIGEGIGILGDDSISFDGGEKYGGKGLTKAVGQVEELAGRVVGYKCSNQGEVDRILEAVYQEKGATWLHAINTLSYTLPKIQSQILNKPLYSIF